MYGSQPEFYILVMFSINALSKRQYFYLFLFFLYFLQFLYL